VYIYTHLSNVSCPKIVSNQDLQISRSGSGSSIRAHGYLHLDIHVYTLGVLSIMIWTIFFYQYVLFLSSCTCFAFLLNSLVTESFCRFIFYHFLPDAKFCVPLFNFIHRFGLSEENRDKGIFIYQLNCGG